MALTKAIDATFVGNTNGYFPPPRPQPRMAIRDRARLVLMKREEVIRRLRDNEALLRQLGVEHLYLFGSTARDEAREESDIDLFFDHPPGSIGLYELMDLKEAAARILGRKTDIMSRRSLHPALRRRIEADAQRVF